MTKIKLCGLSRPCDIEAVNALRPDYIGFVFAEKSRRFVSPRNAAQLKRLLSPSIQAVGVFVQEEPEKIAALAREDLFDIIQLHGKESAAYLAKLRTLTQKPILQAFRIETPEDVVAAEKSSADCILLDSGTGGTGTTFDWRLLQTFKRPYFLAGGLTIENAAAAVRQLHPYGVDVSSGIETDGKKDFQKMAAFVHAVRKVGTT